MKTTTRRRFLAVSGTAVSATLLGPLLLKPERAFGASTVVRRNVGGMVASDPILASYRKAITAMQGLAPNNPLSWAYQAAIHGTLTTPVQAAWNTCEHGTDFFWSWHRMYLYWFERIVRKMCKDPCWALPYWDWAPGSDLHLPVPFRDPASVLFATRNQAMNNGTGSLNPLAVDIGPSFSLINFYAANGSIQAPHGSVHVQVGGGMSSVPTAALDPIFFLHHSNVDRQWNLWLAQGGGRSDPVLDSTWTSRTYTFFNENGAIVKMNACEILRAAQQLHYVYEGEPAQVLQYCRRRPPWPWWEFKKELIMRLPIPPIELKAQPASFPIDLRDIRDKITPLLDSKTDTLLLELEEVEAEAQPGAVWAVFVGLPAGAETDAKSPHFVGQLALFGSGVRDEKHHEYKPAHFAYSINGALQASLKANADRVNVTFVPLGIVIDGKPSRPEVKSPVRIGKASLSVERGGQAR